MGELSDILRAKPPNPCMAPPLEETLLASFRNETLYAAFKFIR